MIGNFRFFMTATAAACIAVQVLWAQDVIYLHSGKEINAAVLRSNAGYVEFQNELTGQLGYVSIAEINMIKYRNGLVVNFICSGCKSTNQGVLQPQLEVAQGESGSDGEFSGSARPKAQIMADLEAITAEMDSKDYAKRKAKLEKFVANSQKMQTKLSSLSSVAPGCYELASFALEILKYTMDMSEQVGTDMKGYITAKSSGSLGKIVISPNKISFETSNTFITKAKTLLAAAAKVKGELTGPTAVVGVPMLAFATAVIPISIKQLTLMTNAAKALRELKASGV